MVICGSDKMKNGTRLQDICWILE